MRLFSLWGLLKPTIKIKIKTLAGFRLVVLQTILRAIVAGQKPTWPIMNPKVSWDFFL